MNNPYNLYKVGLNNKDLVMRLMMYFSPQYKDKSGKILGTKNKTITDFLDRYYKSEQGGYKLNGFDVVKICTIFVFGVNFLSISASSISKFLLT